MKDCSLCGGGEIILPNPHWWNKMDISFNLQQSLQTWLLSRVLWANKTINRNGILPLSSRKAGDLFTGYVPLRVRMPAVVWVAVQSEFYCPPYRLRREKISRNTIFAISAHVRAVSTQMRTNVLSKSSRICSAGHRHTQNENENSSRETHYFIRSMQK